MTAEGKRKIHKWSCITIFTLMMIASLIMVINENTWQYDWLDKTCHAAGILLETPLLIMFIKYMWDYHKLKKEQK